MGVGVWTFGLFGYGFFFYVVNQTMLWVWVSGLVDYGLWTMDYLNMVWFFDVVNQTILWVWVSGLVDYGLWIIWIWFDFLMLWIKPYCECGCVDYELFEYGLIFWYCECRGLRGVLIVDLCFEYGVSTMNA
jgi:hypothetical protein